GCNLVPHPGIDRFRRVLTRLCTRSDVQAVYAQVAELDPGEDRWPFTDTVFVVGTVPADDLRAAVSELQPDEVGAPDGVRGPAAVSGRTGSPVSVIWWD